jgi:hypothetical protein
MVSYFSYQLPPEILILTGFKQLIANISGNYWSDKRVNLP